MSIYDFSAKRLNGEEQSLSDYKGKVLLIVNTASKCGFTPQYDELQQLYLKYRDRGFVVLAFPCNQFGGQEPGTSEEIATFCDLKFNVRFPLFEKINVNGAEAHPLYKFLKQEAPGVLNSEAIKWNFTKFLVDSNGKVIKRFAPKDKPLSIADEIEALLPN